MIRHHPFTVSIQSATLPVLRNHHQKRKEKKCWPSFHQSLAAILTGFPPGWSSVYDATTTLTVPLNVSAKQKQPVHSGFFLSCWTLREFTSRQVLTGFTVTQTSVSNHHHNTTMTHSAVNQPTRCPCSHFGDLGCWEGEDGTCDLGLTAMTAGISKKPQPVLLCVCVSVNNVWAYILSTLYLQTN